MNDDDTGPIGGEAPWLRREEKLRGRPLTSAERTATLLAFMSCVSGKRRERIRVAKRALWAVAGGPPPPRVP